MPKKSSDDAEEAPEVPAVPSSDEQVLHPFLMIVNGEDVTVFATDADDARRRMAERLGRPTI
jgi:hypothetical protein